MTVLEEAESLAKEQRAKQHRVFNLSRVAHAVQRERITKQTAFHRIALNFSRHQMFMYKEEISALKGATRNMFNKGAERVAKMSINAAVNSVAVALLCWARRGSAWVLGEWKQSVLVRRMRAQEEARTQLARRRNFLLSRCMEVENRHGKELLFIWFQSYGRHLRTMIHLCFQQWRFSIGGARDEDDLYKACAEATVLRMENRMIKNSLTESYTQLATANSDKAKDGLRLVLVTCVRFLRRIGFDHWVAYWGRTLALNRRDEAHRRRLLELQLIANPSASTINTSAAVGNSDLSYQRESRIPGIGRPNPLLSQGSIDRLRRVVQRWFNAKTFAALVAWREVVDATMEDGWHSSRDLMRLSQRRDPDQDTEYGERWWEKPRWWEGGVSARNGGGGSTGVRSTGCSHSRGTQNLKTVASEKKVTPHIEIDTCVRCETSFKVVGRHKKAMVRLAAIVVTTLYRWGISHGFVRWEAYRSQACLDKARKEQKSLEGNQSFLRSHIEMLEEQVMHLESKNILDSSRVGHSLHSLSISPSPRGRAERGLAARRRGAGAWGCFFTLPRSRLHSR